MMFEYLGEFSRILVTGPQRSGTTIATRMIAADLGYEFMPEEAFGAQNEVRWRELVRSMKNAVLQCPAMCRYVHEFGAEDDLAAVLMLRPVDEIIGSQKRIGWTHEAEERQRYVDLPYAQDVSISVTKYSYWVQHQRALIKHHYEVAYSSLAPHTLWTPEEMRWNFGPRQTEVRA